MPDKYEWWEPILRWLQYYLPLIGGFSIATTIAYIRERREGMLWKTIFIGSVDVWFAECGPQSGLLNGG
ncbi:Uncharacterised protein [Providencia stuartii]|nr:Uncharacterised protein [Providencia stuartii]